MPQKVRKYPRPAEVRMKREALTGASYRGDAALTRFIENELPTALIYIPELKLMRSGEIAAKARAEIARRARESAEWSDDELNLQSPRCRWDAAVEAYMKDVLQYAILSHRWADGEPTFQEMQRMSAPGHPEWRSLCGQKPGYHKLRRFCQAARSRGCDWAWSDTCCIDKTSSVDLDRAILSMYRWYRDAKLCTVYLAHTTSVTDMGKDPWFTRAWTLQELLAPRRLKFFAAKWSQLAGRTENDMEEERILEVLEKATGISADILLNFVPGTDHLAEKMCWAARREATKIEDVAYSLIGIFGVRMTTAYGEGERAFYRLQLEIMASAPNAIDLLFWCGASSATTSSLARSPQGFANVEDAFRRFYTGRGRSRAKHTAQLCAMTNLGVRTEAVLYQVHAVQKGVRSDAVYEYQDVASPANFSGSLPDFGVRTLPPPPRAGDTYFLAKIAVESASGFSDICDAILLERDVSTGHYRRICADQVIFMRNRTWSALADKEATTVIIN